MNKKNLEIVLNRYVNRFEEFNDKPRVEWYKWNAINHFQKHWNIDADDFATMFNEAVAEIKNTNLIDNTKTPLKGLLEILKTESNVETVRNAFKDLFIDDNGDLESRLLRIDKFIFKINTLILEKFENSWRYPQDRKAVIWYLNLWNPKDNYIFKSQETKSIVACTEYADDIGEGMTFSLAKYYRLCDALRVEIIQNTELLKKHHNVPQRTDIVFDDDYHILVFDIIYCADTYDLYTGMELFKGSAKERIKNIRLRELKEAFEEKQEMLTYLEANKPDFPNLTDQTITHKKFGECVVKSSSENELQIIVKDETKFLANVATLFKNGILVLNNATINERINAINDWEALKHITKLEKSNLQIEINKMTK